VCILSIGYILENAQFLPPTFSRLLAFLVTYLLRTDVSHQYVKCPPNWQFYDNLYCTCPFTWFPSVKYWEHPMMQWNHNWFDFLICHPSRTQWSSSPYLSPLWILNRLAMEESGHTGVIQNVHRVSSYSSHRCAFNPLHLSGICTYSSCYMFSVFNWMSPLQMSRQSLTVGVCWRMFSQVWIAEVASHTKWQVHCFFRVWIWHVVWKMGYPTCPEATYGIRF